MAKEFIKTVEEAHKFLNETYEHAKTMTQKEVAKIMKKSSPGFSNALARASALTQKPVPLFKNLQEKEEKKDQIAKIQASGQGGKSKRLQIPQDIFAKQGWNVGDEFKISLKRDRGIVLIPISDSKESHKKPSSKVKPPVEKKTTRRKKKS